MWDPWISSRGDSWFVCQYVSILIYVFAKQALELKCCALLVQLVKVFGSLCWSVFSVIISGLLIRLCGRDKRKGRDALFSSHMAPETAVCRFTVLLTPTLSLSERLYLDFTDFTSVSIVMLIALRGSVAWAADHMPLTSPCESLGVSFARVLNLQLIRLNLNKQKCL